MKHVSIIIPLFNEEKVVEKLVRALQDATKSLDLNFDFIFVDDGSRDNTLQKLIDIQKLEKRVRIVKLSRNWGHQNACNAGLDNAKGDAVIFMDGDFEDPPEMIPQMIKKWQEGFEIVATMKSSRQETVLKKMFFSLFYKLIDAVSDVPIMKQSGMFSLIDAKALAPLKACREKNKFYVGLRSFVGFKQTALIYDRHKRYDGKAKQSYGRLFRYAFDAFFSFSFLPIRLLTYFGCILFVLIALFSLFIISIRIFDLKFGIFHTMTGWTSITILILFSLAVQLIFMGILGEYIARIFDEVRNRPYYLVDAVFDGDGENETI